MLTKTMWFAVAEDGDCSFQLMVDREYLPTPPVLHAARQRGSLTDPLTADLEARVRALQHTPEACVRGRKAHFPNHGAAATINYLVIQLKRALRDQRPVKFTGKWIYAGCPAQDVSCIFVPETVCNFSSLAHQDEEPRDWALQSHGVYETLGGHGRGGVYPERIPEVDPDFVLPLYKAEGKGVFWYNSVMTGLVFRLLPAMSERVEEEIRHLGLHKASYIGVQVCACMSVRERACLSRRSICTQHARAQLYTRQSVVNRAHTYSLENRRSQHVRMQRKHESSVSATLGWQCVFTVMCFWRD
jgi:hypothetical protein